jgi:hypothetical protein
MTKRTFYRNVAAAADSAAILILAKCFVLSGTDGERSRSVSGGLFDCLRECYLFNRIVEQVFPPVETQIECQCAHAVEELLAEGSF